MFTVHTPREARDLTTPIEGDMDDENGSADVDDIDRCLYDMDMSTDETMERLVTATVYKWRSLDATDSLAFPAASHMVE